MSLLLTLFTYPLSIIIVNKLRFAGGRENMLEKEDFRMQLAYDAQIEEVTYIRTAETILILSGRTKHEFIRIGCIPLKGHNSDSEVFQPFYVIV